MTALAKGVIAIASIGTIGGGVGLGLHFSNNYATVESKLTSEGFQLATTQEEWTKLLEEHNKVSDGNIFKLTSSEQKDANWLKNKCSEALSKEEKDNSNYLLARQWCVKETDIKTILGKSNLKVLDSKNTTHDTTHWPKKLTALKTDDSAINALGITTGKDSIQITDIKGKCTPILDMKTTNKDFNKNIDLAKKWCSISNTTN